MKKIVCLIILTSFILCKEQKDVNKKELICESNEYFKRKKIDIKEFKRDYYIKKSKGNYKNYILRFSKIIKKDTLIIWFSIDDDVEYFIDVNDEFDKHYLKLPDSLLTKPR